MGVTAKLTDVLGHIPICLCNGKPKPYFPKIMRVAVNRYLSAVLLVLFVACSGFSPYTSAQSLVTGPVLAADIDFDNVSVCDLKVAKAAQSIIDSRNNGAAGRASCDSEYLPIQLLLANRRAEQLFKPALARFGSKWKYSCVYPWRGTSKQKENYCACTANFPKHCDRQEYAYSGEGHLIIACACKGLFSKCQP